MTTVTLTQAGFFIQTGAAGQLLTVNSIVGGSGYVDGTYTNVPLTGGHGHGAQATIVVLSGAVTSVTVTASGSGIANYYVIGDTLSASNTNLGGSGTGFAASVATVGVRIVSGLNWTARTSPTGNVIGGIVSLSGTTTIIDDAGNVYHSTDGGHTWTSVSTVPDANTGGMLAQGGSTMIWSGTAVNVDRSTNSGALWTSISTGIPQDAGNSSIVTNGSGTWIVADNVVGAWDISGTTLGVISGSVTSGTFTSGEAITQTGTGATISAIFGTVAPGGPIYFDVAIGGTPDATSLWTGGTSGATYTPTAVPVFPDFTSGETITQAVSGATAYLISGGRGDLNVQGLSITGTPNATNIWTGGTSGTKFVPTTIPVANYTTPMAYSTDDGLTWTPYDPFKGGIPAITPPIWNGSEFVAIILNGVDQSIGTSTDGITWTLTHITTTLGFQALTKFGSNYVAVDGGINKSALASTPAGLATATETSVPLDVDGLSAVVNNSSLIFTFDTVGGVASSSNATSWAVGVLNFTHSLIGGQAVVLNGVNAGLSSHLVAVGNTGVTFASTDGITWTYHYSGQDNDLKGIASGLSVDVAVGGRSNLVSPTGTVLTSSNNTAWTANNQGSNPLNGVAFLNGTTFVTVGAAGTIYGSTTPTGSWTSQTSGVSYDLYSVAGESSSSTFIVGDAGTILHSTNAPGTSMTWTPQAITYIQIPGFVTSNITGSVTSGVFDFADIVTQAVTGATAEVFAINTPYVPDTGPLVVVTSTITGTPNATDIWTQTGSGATFTPTSLPTPTASFTSGENVTQANSGATATLHGTIPGNGPMVLVASSISGFPSTTDVWTGDTSGAQFSQELISTQGFPSTTELLTTVYSHGGTTVAVGAASTIYTTTDSGTTWTSQVIPGGGGTFISITYDTVNSKWVTGYDGAPQLLTSPDGVVWTQLPTGNLSAYASYNNAGSVGSSAVVYVGQASVFESTINVSVTADESSFTDYTAGGSGAFSPGETITQNSTGATATFLDIQTSLGVVNNLIVNTASITGTPDNFHVWVGNTSGAVATPNALPVVDYPKGATYDSTNNSFIAVGVNGSISTYP